MQEGRGAINMMDRDLTRGGKNTIQCAEHVLWNCALEPCIILLSSITPKNLIERRKKEKKS